MLDILFVLMSLVVCVGFLSFAIDVNDIEVPLEIRLGNTAGRHHRKPRLRKQ